MDDRNALGFGGAIHRDDRDAATGGLDGQRLEAIIEIVGQRCAAIADRAHIAKESLEQRVVCLHGIGEHCEGDRRGTKGGWRTVTNVLYRLWEEGRGGLAAIDPECGTVPDGAVEVHIRAGDVIPGQPVEDIVDLVRIMLGIAGVVAQAFLATDHGTHRALRGRNRFRHPGRTGGEEILADGCIVQPGHGVCNRRCGGGCGEFVIMANGILAAGVGRDDLAGIGAERSNRLAEWLVLFSEDDGRFHRAETVFQLFIICRHQGIGHRDRCGRCPDLLGGEDDHGRPYRIA